MGLVLTIRNRQKNRVVNTRLLRGVIRTLLVDCLQTTEADLGVFLVATADMTWLNETFLHHGGSTDVITFDYADPAPTNLQAALHGEIFVCVDEAVAQARRFRSLWQAEVVRYVVHGTLHLLGYDDQHVKERRQMKRMENKLCAGLAARFPLSRLAGNPRLRT